MKRFLIIMQAFALILSGCGPVVEIDLNQNFKDFVCYSPGSYWIYRDSSNYLNKDSVVILANTYKIKEGGEKPTKVQTISTRYYSSKDSIYTIDGEANVYGQSDIPGLGDCGYMDTTASVNYFFVDPNGNPYGGNSYSLSWPGTLKVKNTVYQNVQKYTIPDYKKTVYWSKHVGVIKSIYRGTTWELDTFVVKQ